MLASSLLALALLRQTPPSPPGEPTPQGPETNITATRGEIVLNGVWRFVPAEANQPAPSNDMGLIWVPGDWKRDSGDNPAILREGTSPLWKQDRNELGKAWYERTLTIPRVWQGRRVVLDLRRVSTDAEVFLDGKSMGRVTWPTGTVDLTPSAKPGTSQTLRLLVVATPEAKEVAVLMGVGQVSTTKADLQWRGVMDDVILSSRPLQAHIDDVFVKPSTRKQEIALDLDIRNVVASGPVRFRAEMLNEKGVVEQTFTTEQSLPAAPANKITLTWPWKNPRLWDLDQPNLYTLRLTAEGGGLRDTVLQRFGFREFWIEGRQFRLNGIPFRFRPTLGYDGGVYERSRQEILNMRNRGYNIQEVWPNNDEVRGYNQHWWHHVQVADEMGWPLMGPSTHMDPVVSWWSPEKWSDPQARAAWLATFERTIKRFRNSPSILLWANSGNNFGHNDDQAPSRIGQSRKNPIWANENERWTSHHNRGDQVYAAIRQFDSTRPFMAHQGGPISDVYTANTYLNLLPLQDREEWLSEWAKTGDMPYFAAEFGTPLNCTVLRGRNGFGPAISSEPLVTEFSAMLFGAEAYEKESEDYRKAISASYVGNQEYRWWMFEPTHQYGAPFQMLQELYIRNTWRSWRTWGISGGMVPWAQGHGYETNHGGPNLILGAFEPGQRGLWVPQILSRHRGANQKVYPAGKTLQANSQATLAWIGGKAEQWTEKSHSFWPGAKIAKSVILINDERTPQPYEANWTVNGVEKTLSGTIPAGENLILPIEFTAAAQPGNFTLGLTARIGRTVHLDRFSYRVFAKPAKGSGSITIWDPVGKTSAMLRTAGYTLTPASATSQGFVVVGREALSSGATPPLDLEKFVSGGGRLLVMTQSPEWFRDRVGFRIASYASRRAFPMQVGNPITEGLTAADLSDWTGIATLKEAYPDPKTLPRPKADHTPTYGWAWGMRGVVSSVMLEKPHRASWTPLIEGEFDLAYSPLLTQGFGRGRVTINTLDLEDQYGVEPVAQILLPRVISAAQAPAEPKSTQVALLGDDQELLDAVGLPATPVASLTSNFPLTVIGANANVTPAQVTAYLNRGGKVLFLPRTTGFGPMTLKENKEFSGSLSLPTWPEAAGLSPSDLRRRSPSPAWLVQTGEVGAGGQLGRWKEGRGVAIFFQMDPNLLNADTRTFLRFTRWRQTRALAQTLANLGAQFPQDARFFRPGPEIKAYTNLTGEWQVQMTDEAPQLPDTATGDPGPSARALALLHGGNAGQWQKHQIPGYWPAMDGKVCEAVFRITVTVPANRVGKDMVLRLGMVDDFDTTSFNGEVVGTTNRTTKEWWSHRRAYQIPGRLVKAENVITVRVLNSQGAGGIGGPAHHMGLDLKGFVAPLALYHPDYRTDFELGDDPYRYYRW